MRKRLLIGFTVVLLSIGLIGCDNRDTKNLDIYTEGYKINTTESITIRTYNGYKLIDSEIINNNDGSITVILDINKPIK